MRDKKYAGIIAGLFVVAITGFTIWGTDFLSAKSADVAEAIEVTGAENVKEASRMKDKDGNVTGYVVTTSTKGFAGDVELKISFEADAKTVKGMELGTHSETEGLGANIGTPEYTGDLAGKAAPVSLKGSNGTGTEIDGVTGATFSSKAVESGINSAYDFIQSNK